ncbi:nucleotide-binding alpha-beta plait domain-containing protein [Artemisia annua]|uniref:Nucleotide-binding alpha-beta plait domain-containing protein n=1 Tax=Artemisia annua TaxID=35608 RepID=A0A2U1P097_ARTAN|nr:nucleotide-binding alpha-beta plait domain-containing protein [Artemisia annua]
MLNVTPMAPPLRCCFGLDLFGLATDKGREILLRSNTSWLNDCGFTKNNLDKSTYSFIGGYRGRFVGGRGPGIIRNDNMKGHGNYGGGRAYNRGPDFGGNRNDYGYRGGNSRGGASNRGGGDGYEKDNTGGGHGTVR